MWEANSPRLQRVVELAKINVNQCPMHKWQNTGDFVSLVLTSIVAGNFVFGRHSPPIHFTVPGPIVAVNQDITN